MATFKSRPAELERMLGISKVRALTVQGELVRQRAIVEAPIKTGHLRAHIVKRFDGPERMLVGVQGVPYAIYVHEGARPHVIRGNPLLVFYWPKVGKTVYFRRVNHPGNRPNRFLVRALAAIRRGK
jgi:hypothetical protein